MNTEMKWRPIASFVEKLKARLDQNKGNYLDHNSWIGDTESGFHSEDRFDFDALIKEIDKFSAEFVSEQYALEQQETAQ